MSVNTIVHLSLLNFLIYQHNAFALFHRIPSSKKIFDHKVFSTTTNHIYRASLTETDKEADLQLFFQNLPRNSEVQKKNIDSSVHHQSLKQEIGEHHTALVDDDFVADSKDPLPLKLSKLKDFATEGDLIIQKLRTTAYSLIEVSENELCSIDDLECETSEENYLKALDVARDADLKFGLGTYESLHAWDTVDEMYLKLESHNSQKDDVATKEDKKLKDILDACNKLESAFRDLKTKIDRNDKKRDA